MSSKDLLHEKSMTPGQKRCFGVLVKTFGGKHHISGGQYEPRVYEYGKGIKVNRYDGLATFDTSDLTRLVIFAHIYCCRVEIVQSGPRMIGICVHPRNSHDSSKSQWDWHPNTDHLIAMIESLEIISKQPIT